MKNGDRVRVVRSERSGDVGRAGTILRTERILCGDRPIAGHIYPLRVSVLLDPRGDAGPDRHQFEDSQLEVLSVQA